MTPTDAAVYEVTFEGPVLLDEVVATFEGLSVEPTATGVIVCGRLCDQAAVHGVLSLGRSIGLDLVEMHRLRPVVDPARQELSGGRRPRTQDS